MATSVSARTSLVYLSRAVTVSPYIGQIPQQGSFLSTTILPFLTLLLGLKRYDIPAKTPTEASFNCCFPSTLSLVLNSALLSLKKGSPLLTVGEVKLPT